MRLHLVDGTYELFRAHFARRPPHLGPDGTDLKATVGVVQSLLALLEDRDEAVTHLAVAFDNPIVSFRNRLFAGYKSDEGVPPELRAQFDGVEEAVKALGVTVWRMVDFEADDALATGAALHGGPDVEVRLLSPDKDLRQCLKEGQVVLVDRLRGKVTTQASHQAEKGFGPASMPDFLALVGDTADGIPGLDGWGEVGASQVLGVYPHLEDIPPLPGQWKVQPRGAKALSATLEAHRLEAALYRTLATLRTDVPGLTPLEALRFTGTPREAYLAWCQAVGASERLEAAPRAWR